MVKDIARQLDADLGCGGQPVPGAPEVSQSCVLTVSGGNTSGRVPPQNAPHSQRDARRRIAGRLPRRDRLADSSAPEGSRHAGARVPFRVPCDRSEGH